MSHDRKGGSNINTSICQHARLRGHFAKWYFYALGKNHFTSRGGGPISKVPELLPELEPVVLGRIVMGVGEDEPPFSLQPVRPVNTNRKHMTKSLIIVSLEE